jgi:hypothetical protein
LVILVALGALGSGVRAAWGWGVRWERLSTAENDAGWRIHLGLLGWAGAGVTAVVLGERGCGGRCGHGQARLVGPGRCGRGSGLGGVVRVILDMAVWVGRGCGCSGGAGRGGYDGCD